MMSFMQTLKNNLYLNCMVSYCNKEGHNGLDIEKRIEGKTLLIMSWTQYVG